MKALSIRQPWAWLVAEGHKDIENRTWDSDYRGSLYIHAAQTMTRRDYDACQLFLDSMLNPPPEPIFLPDFYDLHQGGIIGVVLMLGCLKESASPWFTGPYGFMLGGCYSRMKFKPCKGQLGIFNV